MRRFKQQISDEKCIEILKTEPRGVLALHGEDGYPYALPLNQYYHNGKLYFHCAAFVTDPAEKETALRLLGNKFYPDPEDVEREIEKFLDKVCILKMSIDHMTGKLVNES